MKECNIRSETVNDYQNISDVHTVTFNYSYGMGEATLINVLRSRRSFDPDLSLIAEINGKIVGHVLFTPQRILLDGKFLDAVLLAPVAVYPDFQNMGVGSKLIEEGHRRAGKKGFQLSILLGHTEYYKRFGYQPRMWSNSSVLFPRSEIPSLTKSVKERRIQVNDLENLNELWNRWNRGNDLALLPDSSITSWISPGKEIQTSIIEVEGNFAGYLRYDKYNPTRILNILTKDSESLLTICAYISGKLVQDDVGFISLPISPEACEQNKVTIEYRTENISGSEKMLKILNDNSYVSDYCQAVLLENRLPGNIIWPVEFDVC